MKSVVLKIDGMTCSACSQGLEKYLQKQKGIIEASVNLILSTATIKYEMISIKEIEKYIEKAGFKSGGEFIGIENDCQLENIKWLIIMGVLLIILMCISMGPMIGLFEIVCMNRTKLGDSKEDIVEIVSRYFVPYSYLLLILHQFFVKLAIYSKAN